jgi:quercetin dioxygenase-like cupin family protein
LLLQATAPGRVAGALLTFEPGARTAWHTHPLGQTLVVLSGLGRIQREGGPVEEIRPGDVVTIAAGGRHWHGASRETAMSDIAIQEALDGKNVDWLEHVTDDQYLARGVYLGGDAIRRSRVGVTPARRLEAQHDEPSLSAPTVDQLLGRETGSSPKIGQMSLRGTRLDAHASCCAGH